jgi:hypothetical protein
MFRGVGFYFRKFRVPPGAALLAGCSRDGLLTIVEKLWYQCRYAIAPFPLDVYR